MSSTETPSSPRSATSRSAASCNASRVASFSLQRLHGVSLPPGGDGLRDVVDAGPVTRPTVVLRPHPHGVHRIFTPEALATLQERYRVVDVAPDDDATLDAALPEAFAVIGQPDLPRVRLEKAPHLRAIL